MTGIPHFEDLKAQAIYDSLDLVWWPSEKLDGSYFLFGLDEDGRYFCQRKGSQPCYDLSDWPLECWANTYRSGHVIGSMVVDSLIKENLISPGQKIGSEIIHGSQPNTIMYALPDDLTGYLVITAMNFDAPKELYQMFNEYYCSAPVLEISSADGINASTIESQQLWKVKINSQISRHLVQARLAPHAAKFKRVLDHWFPTESKVSGFSIIEVLDLNLSKKHPNCGDRNWNELKKELAQERAELKEVFRALVLMFKDTAYRVLVLEQQSSISAGSLKEGVVVNSNQGLFKLVDLEVFQPANRFTHLIKYWLVGGRRPARSCFLSRTRDWPKEKRLKRLDVLLERYKSRRLLLQHNVEIGGRVGLLCYHGQLHQRTLNMFCDTRKRIEDGR